MPDQQGNVTYWILTLGTAADPLDYTSNKRWYCEGIAKQLGKVPQLTASQLDYQTMWDSATHLFGSGENQIIGLHLATERDGKTKLEFRLSEDGKSIEAINPAYSAGQVLFDPERDIAAIGARANVTAIMKSLGLSKYNPDMLYGLSLVTVDISTLKNLNLNNVRAGMLLAVSAPNFRVADGFPFAEGSNPSSRLIPPGMIGKFGLESWAIPDNQDISFVRRIGREAINNLAVQEKRNLQIKKEREEKEKTATLNSGISDPGLDRLFVEPVSKDEMMDRLTIKKVEPILSPNKVQVPSATLSFEEFTRMEKEAYDLGIQIASLERETEVLDPYKLDWYEDEIDYFKSKLKEHAKLSKDDVEVVEQDVNTYLYGSIMEEVEKTGGTDSLNIGGENYISFNNFYPHLERIALRPEESFLNNPLSFTRIGYTVLEIPPNQIQFAAENGIISADLLRHQGTILSLDNYQPAQIIITVTISGERMYNEVLIPLFAQFNRTPFLPIENPFLNGILNIDAIAIRSLQIQTIPQTPFGFSLQIIAEPFEWRNYLPHEGNSNFSDLFCWPFFRAYCESKSIKKGRDFRYPTEGSLAECSISIGIPDENKIKQSGILEPNKQTKPGQDRVTRMVLGDSNKIAVENSAPGGDYVTDIKRKPPWEAQPTSKHLISDGRTLDLQLLHSHINPLLSKRGTQSEKLSDQTIYVADLSSGRVIASKFHDPDVILMLLDYKDVKAYNNVYIQKDSLGIASLVTEPSSGLAPSDVAALKSNIEKLRQSGVTIIQPNGDTKLPNNPYFIIPEKSQAFVDIAKVSKIPFDTGQGLGLPNVLEEELFTTIRLSEASTISSATVQFSTHLSAQQIQNAEYPVHQYLGSNCAIISIEGVLASSEDLYAFKSALDQVKEAASKYRITAFLGPYVGYMKIHNPFINSFGIDAIMPIDFKVETIHGVPGAYQFSLTALEYNRHQGNAEEFSAMDDVIAHVIARQKPQLERLAMEYRGSGTEWQALLDDLIQRTDKFGSRAFFVQHISEKLTTEFWRHSVLHIVLRQIELYPDLCLPTRHQVNLWIGLLKRAFQGIFPSKDFANERRDLGLMLSVMNIEDNKLIQTVLGEISSGEKSTTGLVVGDTVGYVDPDFYCIPSVDAAEFKKQMLDGSVTPGNLAEVSSGDPNTPGMLFKDSYGYPYYHVPGDPFGKIERVNPFITDHIREERKEIILKAFEISAGVAQKRAENSKRIEQTINRMTPIGVNTDIAVTLLNASETRSLILSSKESPYEQDSAESYDRINKESIGDLPIYKSNPRLNTVKDRLIDVMKVAAGQAVLFYNNKYKNIQIPNYYLLGILAGTAIAESSVGATESDKEEGGTSDKYRGIYRLSNTVYSQVRGFFDTLRTRGVNYFRYMTGDSWNPSPTSDGNDNYKIANDAFLSTFATAGILADAYGSNYKTIHDAYSRVIQDESTLDSISNDLAFLMAIQSNRWGAAVKNERTGKYSGGAAGLIQYILDNKEKIADALRNKPEAMLSSATIKSIFPPETKIAAGYTAKIFRAAKIIATGQMTSTKVDYLRRFNSLLDLLKFPQVSKLRENIALQTNLRLDPIVNGTLVMTALSVNVRYEEADSEEEIRISKALDDRTNTRWGVPGPSFPDPKTVPIIMWNFRVGNISDLVQLDEKTGTFKLAPGVDQESLIRQFWSGMESTDGDSKILTKADFLDQYSQGNEALLGFEDPETTLVNFIHTGFRNIPDMKPIDLIDEIRKIGENDKKRRFILPYAGLVHEQGPGVRNLDLTEMFSSPLTIEHDSAFHSFIHETPDFRLVKAFPTFFVAVLDSGRWLGIERLWDHVYAGFGINSIDIIQSRHTPVDVATVTFSNLYGRLTSQAAYEQTVIQHDTRRELRISSIIEHAVSAFRRIVTIDLATRWSQWAKLTVLRPGARLHIRLGFGADASRLPVKFNGTISEVPVAEAQVQVVALGDGQELIREFPDSDPHLVNSGLVSRNSPDGELAGTSKVYFNSGFMGGKEPRNIIMELFEPAHPILATITRGWFLSDNPYGIEHFGSVDYESYFHYGEEEVGVNVYQAKDDPFNNSSQWANWAINQAFLKTTDSELIGIELDRASPWKVIYTCRMALHDFIAAVRPFEFRSTLFFGKPWFPFFYKYKDGFPTASEALGSTRMDTKDQSSNADVTLTTLGRGKEPKAPVRGDNKVAPFMDYKAFTQFHYLSSFHNIISCNIIADGSNIITNCQAKYVYGSLDGETSEAGDLMMADHNIFPEHQRTILVSTGLRDVTPLSHIRRTVENVENFVLNLPGIVIRYPKIDVAYVPEVANNYAANVIRDSVAEMYQGYVLIQGDPTINPWDFCYLFDSRSGLTGFVQVKEVENHFSLEAGYVTTISPDAVVSNYYNSGFLSWLTVLMSFATSYHRALIAAWTAALGLRLFTRASVMFGTLLRWSRAIVMVPGSLIYAPIRALALLLWQITVGIAERKFIRPAVLRRFKGLDVSVVGDSKIRVSYKIEVPIKPEETAEEAQAGAKATEATQAAKDAAKAAKRAKSVATETKEVSFTVDMAGNEETMTDLISLLAIENPEIINRGGLIGLIKGTDLQKAFANVLLGTSNERTKEIMKGGLSAVKSRAENTLKGTGDRVARAFEEKITSEYVTADQLKDIATAASVDFETEIPAGVFDEIEKDFDRVLNELKDHAIEGIPENTIPKDLALQIVREYIEGTRSEFVNKVLEEISKEIEKQGKNVTAEAMRKIVEEKLGNASGWQKAQIFVRVANIKSEAKNVLDRFALQDYGYMLGRRFIDALKAIFGRFTSIDFINRAFVAGTRPTILGRVGALSVNAIKEDFKALFIFRGAGGVISEEIEGGIAKGIGSAFFRFTGGPISWIAQATYLIMTESIADAVTRELVSMHAVHVVPLTIKGLEFTAGLEGHAGAIVGDKPLFLDDVVHSIFNPGYNSGLKKHWYWAIKGFQLVVGFMAPGLFNDDSLPPDDSAIEKIQKLSADSYNLFFNTYTNKEDHIVALERIKDKLNLNTAPSSGQISNEVLSDTSAEKKVIKQIIDSSNLSNAAKSDLVHILNKVVDQGDPDSPLSVQLRQFGMPKMIGKQLFFAHQLARFIQAAATELGKDAITINNSFRTTAEQINIHNRGGFSGRPGFSLHQYALAADLTFNAKGAKEWAHKHAAEFDLWFPFPNRDSNHIESIATRMLSSRRRLKSWPFTSEPFGDTVYTQKTPLQV